MLRASRIVSAIVLAAFAAISHAEGNITFGNGPAVRPDTDSANPKAPDGNGVRRAVFSPVTPKDSEQAIKSRVLPTDLNKRVAPARVLPKRSQKSTSATVSAARVAGDAAASGPASIAELAAALRYDPDLIYEYVRNNIEYYPIWGVQKGALGAVLDNQGTAFDQAVLMVSLLRQAGYTASYEKGRIGLTAAQVRDWLGVDTNNVCAVLNLLSSGQIPIASVTATAAGSCPGSTAALHSMKIDHVWVKVSIGGTNYVFDPSFKPHSIKPGINLNTASGYDAASYLTTARTGATITGDYVQAINRTGIRNTLTTYANSLASYIRANVPASDLDDVIGGMNITPHTTGALRQTTLPYQDTAVAVTPWTDIPAVYSPTLRVQYSAIDSTFTSDAIYGKRLTITYNASNQPVLSLDGVVQATGTAVTPGTYGTVTFTATHGAYAQTFANQVFSQSIKAGSTYLIGNGWGPAGRGVIEYHRTRLEEAKAAGSSDTSEAVMGSSLAVLSTTWIAQVNFSDYIADRVAKTTTQFHHQIGIAGFDNTPYVDLPGNMLSVVSQTADAAKERAVFYSAAMHSSIFESTAVQQTSGVSAVSTVKLIDIASANNDKIYDARSANYASAVQPNLVSCSSWLTNFQNAINAGYRLILPTRCNIAENTWSGAGYFQISGTGNSIGAIIGGGMAGGLGSQVITAQDYTSRTAANQCSAAGTWLQSTGLAYGEPIDMLKGNYLYSHDDMKVGASEFPHSLSLQRLYSSGQRMQSGPLGKGWTHNFATSVVVGSDGFQGMGEDSALDAVTTIVEKLVSLDLLIDAAKPLDKMVIATLGQRWFGDQLLNNTVIVRQGLNGEVFVKLPDGTYNPPPANSARLVLNANSTYTYETLNRNKLNFNIAGKIVTYIHSSGVQVNFTYSGNDLTQVQNSLGHTLTFTNTSGRISQVSDGNGRNVTYGYNATTNDLTTFTDAALKSTTFQYDLPGRLTKFFYPSNPTLAFITNVYDTLGRVQTQTNVHNKLYSYYFAGSRSEEVGPGNVSNVSYLDGMGRILRAVNPLGRITTNIYDGQGRVIQRTSPEANSVQYTYDDPTCSSSEKRCTHNVKTVSQVAKAGSGLANLITSFTYESAFNKVASVTDPRLKVTDFTYTPQGNPLTSLSPADAAGVRPSTTYSYTAFTPSGYPSFYLLTSQSSLIASGNSVITTYGYNTANRYVPQTTTVDEGTGKLNLVTSYTYDGVGNLTQTNGPRNDVIDTFGYLYDAERRVTQITDALNKVTKRAYDADGHLIRTAAQTGAQWLVSCNSYTASGMLLKEWGPGTTAADTTCPVAAAPVPVKDYAYDDLDRLVRVTENLTATEGGNRVTEIGYDAKGSVQSVRRAVGTGVAQTYVAYTFTANDQVSTVTDAKGNVTTYQYDGHDRRITTLFPDKLNGAVSSTTDFEQYGYDNNGNVTTTRKRSGQTITSAYDNLNRVVSRTYPVAGDSVSFNYDLLGRRLVANYSNGSFGSTYTYDNAGRLISTTTGGKTLAHEYDAAGNRTRITWPEGGFYVSYTYDALNRPTSIKENGTVDLVTGYVYDDLSRRTLVTLGNGTTTTYAYDNQAALVGLTQNLAGAAQDVAFNYPRNQAREVTTQNWNNDLYQWSGYSNGSRSYTTNGLNQYTTAAGATISYDANGNLSSDGVWTYGYDLDNRLKSATSTGVTAALQYDAEGRLRETTIGGITTRLLYAGADLIAEYDSGGNLLRRYVHGNGIDETLVAFEGTGTTNKSWLYADHLGSVIATTDVAGNSTSTLTYGPYGEPNQTTGARFRYTGQQLLGQLNLYYYKARFYSPTLGRFLQTDPIGYVDDLNLYTYVGNNPTNNTDPEGLFVSQVVGGVFNAGVGALITYHTGGATVGQYLRNAAFDFGIGAISSGMAGVSKLPMVAKVLTATNTGVGKALSAGGGEVAKGLLDGKQPEQYALQTVVAGVLNGSGVVGKVAEGVAGKFGLKTAGYLPSPSVAALLQPKAGTGEFVASIVRESFGAPMNYGAGSVVDSLGGYFGSNSSAPSKTAK